jgi:serine/threonine-protein kinase
MIYIDINRTSYQIEDNLIINGMVYQYESHIDDGGNGIVNNYLNVQTGDFFAVKIIPLFSNKEAERIHTELEILKHTKHDNIIKYYGHKITKIRMLDKHRQPLRDIRALFIVMEKAECNLKNFIRENKLDFSIYSAQIIGLCEGLNTLHEIAIHRDLKPENILVTDSHWVISDFGLCSKLDGTSPEITSPTKAIGPRFWLSPEAYTRYLDIEEHRKDIIFKSDIYQMCAIFWFIINRKHPSGILSLDDFDGPKQLYDPIVRGLQHDNNRRYTSTSEFLETFKQAILETEMATV